MIITDSGLFMVIAKTTPVTKKFNNEYSKLSEIDPSPKFIKS